MDIFQDEITNQLKKLTKLENISLEMPPDQKLGDYAFPCFEIAKLNKKNPVQVAQELSKGFAKTQLIERIEVKGPYLNFFINKSAFVEQALSKILKEKEKYGAGNKRQKIMVEYCAPNTNKPLHLGHLRNIMLGKTISNLLSFQGNTVIQVNLVNDRGVHICKSMLAYQKWGNNKKPDKKSDHFVGDFYILYAQHEKEHPELETEIQDMLVKWENKDKEIRALWKKMNDWALKGFDETFKKLGIKFDKVYYESDYFDKAKEVVQKGLEQGIFAKDKDNNIIVKLEQFGLPDKVVLRADGTTVYITQDIYLAKLKFDEYKLDKSIYVVGSEQNLHFKQLFKILELLKLAKPENCHHLSYGMVNLPEGKMKSREGTVVDIDNFIEEIAEVAKKELKERYTLTDEELQQRAEIIGLGAIRFFILKTDPGKDMLYDPKESVSFEGETGPYVLYTYARLSSIIRKSEKLPKKVDYSLLKSDIEHKIVKQLSIFPQIISDAAHNYKPHLLTRYLLDLSQLANEFYHNSPILKEEKALQEARLVLIECVRNLIKHGLSLMDIDVLERM
jgi:arginyl-tRNA synthetase